MGWFEQTTANVHSKDDWLTSIGKSARQSFALSFHDSFARRGIAATVSARTPGFAFRNVFNRPFEHGSPEHINNLKKLQRMEPDNESIAEALKRARAPKATSFASKLARGALGGVGSAAFTVLPAFVTPGGVKEKGRAVVGGIVGGAGAHGGMLAGAATGAALGSVFPVIGTGIGLVAGGLAGALAGGLGTDYLYQKVLGVADRAVDRQRDMRKLDWVKDQSAFQTKRAYTMRQQSLQAMNRGMTTSRSLMGREAMFTHI